MSFSFWESDYFSSNAGVAVIGTGIVGLSTAIHLKRLNPGLKVVAIDRQWPPHGASTKNAGFMCFGSPTEITDDIEQIGEEQAMLTFKARYEGRTTLFTLLQDADIDYQNCGGIELMEKHDNQNVDIGYLNALIKNVIGVNDYFKTIENITFPNFSKEAYLATEEGKVNPVKIVSALKRLADLEGVNFVFKEIKQLDDANATVIFKDGSIIQADQLAITLNAFTPALLPGIDDVVPARNNVLVTSPVPEFRLEQVLHIDKGYLYMRKVGDRILFGGARNKFGPGEYTDDLQINEAVIAYLVEYLKQKMGVQSEFSVDYTWAGILGVGKSKKPIISRINQKSCVGVRLGGMGVAIGAKVGKDLAELILDIKN